VVGYLLQRKNAPLGFIMIAVDYFQVLSIFARSKIAWPPAVERMLQLMSIFNINIEITAPECSFDITYELKWTITMLLPVLALTIFGLIHVFAYLRKRCILGQKENLHSHAPVMVSVSLTTMYYLYLFLTRSTLDIFNCGPTDPPDGHTYLEVVFERCWQAGGVQMTLFPFALITLGVYVVGYPAFVVAMLWRNKHLVKEDQLLRASGLGDTRLTNPRAYAFRKMFGKMYNNFMPGKWYWILVVITRKALLAFTSLMFRRTPSYQLSVSLVVLFASFVLQVRHVPYMPPKRYGEALLIHRAKVAASSTGTSKHDLIEDALQGVHAEVSKQQRFKARAGVSEAEQMRGQTREVVVTRISLWLSDLNALELVLLAGSVLINLCGIMLQSGRFEGGNYEQQRLMLSVCIFLVIGVTFAFVTAVAMFHIAPAAVTRICSKQAKLTEKQKAELSAAEAPSQTQSGQTLNPMFAAAFSRVPDHAGSEDSMMQQLPVDTPDQADWAMVQAAMLEILQAAKS
jgi:hypothetical protein